MQHDWQRRDRTGLPECVLCAGKAPSQIDEVLGEAVSRGHSLLLTRLAPETLERLSGSLRGRLDYDPLSATAILDCGLAPPRDQGVGIVSAGSSDAPVALEARRTLRFLGIDAALHADIGVAGLWRLLDRVETLARLRVIIAVAGMEGALFTVLAGLVPALVVAVPTSVGYGVADGGRAALNAALLSCAPGVVAVNIDNGYGAAMAAAKLCRQIPP